MTTTLNFDASDPFVLLESTARLTTTAVYACALLAIKKVLNPVAPVYKYCLISVTNILTTTCQYEALKYVSFPVQTLIKCAEMIHVIVWGTLIMQKKYKGFDYLEAFLVTLGCSVFILFSGDDVSPYNKGRENIVWGVSLMAGYLGFDGFTSTWRYINKYSTQHFVLVF